VSGKIDVLSHIKSIYKNTNVLIISATALLLLLLISYLRHIDNNLGKSEIISGYTLFFLILLLMSFRIRKYLSVIPLFKVQYWTKIHLIAGISGVLIFFVHTEVLWPKGLYEQIMTSLFYMTVLSGLLGYIMQRIFPARLTDSGIEIIFERIPDQLAEIRKEVESIILDCTDNTKSDTLAKHYLETLDWYFMRPRFFLNHIRGGRQGQHWIVHQFTSVKRYLNNAEIEYLNKLLMHAHSKNQVDFHYALQGCMKAWLFFHIPVAIALLIFVLWHLLLINIYSV